MDNNSSSRILITIVIAIIAFAGGWFLHIKKPDLFGGVGSVTEVREGVYNLLGSNPDSKTVNYGGTVTVKRTGMIYDLGWSIAGSQTQRGVGILDRGVLSVGYIDVTGGEIKDAGAVSYILDSSEKLRGTWSSVTGGSVGTETLVWRGE